MHPPSRPPSHPVRALLVHDAGVAPLGPARGVPYAIAYTAPLADAPAVLAEGEFDLVLLALPAGEAPLAAVLALREQSPDVPVVVLTESDDEALAVEALQAGAQDVLVRGAATGAALARAVRFAIERHRVQAALHAMALVDDLTGLYNRRGFLTLARQQLKMAERMHRGLVHIFFDLDGMKQINDTFGHREGDLALIESAEILRTTFRQSDVLARIGGDEFAVLAMETSEVRADLLFVRLQETLDERNARGHRPYALSFSMGTTTYEPGRSSSVEELLAQADRMMYQHKRRRGLTPRDLQKI